MRRIYCFDPTRRMRVLPSGTTIYGYTVSDSTPAGAPENMPETPEQSGPGENGRQPGLQADLQAGTDVSPQPDADAPAHAAQEEDTPFPEADEEQPVTPSSDSGRADENENALPADMDEDGVALHFMAPQDPGTILVAVAEPSDMHSGSLAEGWDAPSVSGASGVSGAPEPVTPIPNYGDLTEVAAVRLGGLGPALFFTTNGVECAPGDQVIVEMEEGQAFGDVASVMRMIPAHLEEAAGEDGKIRPLVRKATDKDALSAESNRNLATEALAYCRECIRERNLDMKLVDVLILHDRSKMIFYFTAPARIDFRELVKDLVRRYRTRIELRQIGVRHETQMVGALGNCGMVCCCRRYLRKFSPVAIKMAKEQNVFLNPVKISGICGRLLCCLAYEQEHYDEFYRSCPKLGKKYHTDAGVFRVLRASLFRESVTVLSETGEEVEYPLAEWNAMSPYRPNASQQQQQQAARKDRPHDRQENDGRPRKSGARGGRPVVSPTARHGGKTADDAGDGGLPEAAPMADVQESATIVVREERTVITEEGGGAVIAESRSVTAVFTESLRPADDDRDSDDDDFDEAADDASGDVSDDDGGSIFGLSPRRNTPDTARDAGGEGSRDDGNRRKRPRRRKPRSSES